MTDKENSAQPGGLGAEGTSNTEQPEAKATTTEEQLQSARFSRVRQRAGKDKRLNRTDLAVLIALGGYSNREGWCRPSQQAIADDAGTDRRKVDTVLKRLEQFGYLTRVVRRPRANGYWLQFSDDHAPVQAHSVLAPVMAECAPSGASQCAPSGASQCAPSGASDAPLQAHEQPIYQPNREQPREVSLPQVIEQPAVQAVELLPRGPDQFPIAGKIKTPASISPPPVLDAEQPLLLAAPSDAEVAFDLWNEMAREVGGPKRGPVSASVLDKSRRQSLGLRLAELGGIPGWKIMLGKIRDSDWLAGKKGWRINLEWICKPKNLRKVMEGNYDQESRNDGGEGLGDHGDLTLMEQLARYARGGAKGDGRL